MMLQVLLFFTLLCSSGASLKLRGLRRLEGIPKSAQQKQAAGPVVCVVVTVHDVEGYLQQSIHSVISQSYPFLEIVVVNDASKDDSRKIIDMWAREDERVTALHLPFGTYGGAGQPTNIGMASCKGKYIALVDGDDFVVPDMIGSMVEQAEKYSLDVVISDFNTIDDEFVVKSAYDHKYWDQIARGQAVTNAQVTPDLLRMSPVPWRKLYKRAFLNDNELRFPEGDYFFEDNAFHWHVMWKAERVGHIDNVSTYHRKNRKGQTISNLDKEPAKKDNIAMAGYFANMNYIGRLLDDEDADNIVFKRELFAWLHRTRWIVKQGGNTNKGQRKFEAIYYKTIKQMLANSESIADQGLQKTLGEYSKCVLDIEVSIVIPAHNAKDNVVNVLHQMFTQGSQWADFNFEVIVVDDNSSDGLEAATQQLCDRHDNLYFIKGTGLGAGRARNMAIPLIEGKYAFFLDADDTINFNALKNAVVSASDNDVDLMFVPYNLSMPVSTGSTQMKMRNMFNDDENIWQRRLQQQNNNPQFWFERKGAKLRGTGDVEIFSDQLMMDEKKLDAFSLINYPWNRIVRSKMIATGDIFFGPTPVHNDIQYHWTTINLATSIEFFHEPVCVHRKAPGMKQITNIATPERLAVVDAIRLTDRVLEHDGFYESNPQYAAGWKTFITHVLTWATPRVPKQCKSLYTLRKGALTKQLRMAPHSPLSAGVMDRSATRKSKAYIKAESACYAPHEEIVAHVTHAPIASE